MIISDEDRQRIQSILRFADLKDMRSAKRVEKLFRSDKYPLWRSLHPTDTRDLQTMQRNLRRWLDWIVTRDERAFTKLRRDLVKQFQNDCAEPLHALAPVAPDRRNAFKSVATFRLWGIPSLTLDKRSYPVVSVTPLITGVQSAVWYALILLFITERWRNLGRCDHCERIYLRTKALRAACSDRCKKKLRSKKVAKAVKKWRHRDSEI